MMSDPSQGLDDTSSLKMSVLSHGSVKLAHESQTSVARRPILLDTDEVYQALKMASNSVSFSDETTSTASGPRTVGNREVLIVGVSCCKVSLQKSKENKVSIK